jgi:hypothetical protein
MDKQEDPVVRASSQRQCIFLAGEILENAGIQAACAVAFASRLSIHGSSLIPFFP